MYWKIRNSPSDTAVNDQWSQKMILSQHVTCPSNLSFIIYISITPMRLILYVNFTGPRDMQKAGKTLFLDVSVRVFPEEISIWIYRLRKEDHPYQGRWATFNQLRAQIEHKKRKSESILLVGVGTFIFCPQTSALLVLGHFDLDSNLYHWLLQFSALWAWIGSTSPAFLGLQTVDGRSWDFSVSIIAWTYLS